jgi:uncharacterized membrane protein
MATLPELAELQTGRTQNVADWERWASILAGGGLAAGLLRGRWRLLIGLIGAGLIYRGATGHCHLYEALGINRSSTAR